MIDVIIPAYNSHDTIEQTLFSIAYQDILDKLNVYIVNDCSDKDYSEFINFFSNFMNIVELKLEKNCGPGVARQYGIDNSKNEFIVFIDSDDVFSDCFALGNLLDTIIKNNCDVVIGDFVEEYNDKFFVHSNDTIWLHGKIYRRSFLNNKYIKFNQSRANEDNGFNQLVIINNAKILFLDKKTYIWRNNHLSITRVNNRNYSYNGLFGYIYNMTWALKKGLEMKGNINIISELSFATLVTIYYYYLEYSKIENSDKLINLSKNIKNIADKFPLSNEKKINIFEDQAKFMINENNKKYTLIPKITFEQFLNLIDESEGI